MKERISATVEEKTNKMVNSLIKDGKYRNKSHVIEKAIEKLFKVTVLEVRTIVMKGKVKRVGRKFGKRSDFKKAYITLKEGDKIWIMKN